MMVLRLAVTTAAVLASVSAALANQQDTEDSTDQRVAYLCDMEGENIGSQVLFFFDRGGRYAGMVDSREPAAEAHPAIIQMNDDPLNSEVVLMWERAKRAYRATLHLEQPWISVTITEERQGDELHSYGAIGQCGKVR